MIRHVVVGAIGVALGMAVAGFGYAITMLVVLEMEDHG